MSAFHLLFGKYVTSPFWKSIAFAFWKTSLVPLNLMFNSELIETKASSTSFWWTDFTLLDFEAMDADEAVKILFLLAIFLGVTCPSSLFSSFYRWYMWVLKPRDQFERYGCRYLVMSSSSHACWATSYSMQSSRMWCETAWDSWKMPDLTTFMNSSYFSFSSFNRSRSCCCCFFFILGTVQIIDLFWIKFLYLIYKTYVAINLVCNWITHL